MIYVMSDQIFVITGCHAMEEKVETVFGEEMPKYTDEVQIYGRNIQTR